MSEGIYDYGVNILSYTRLFICPPQDGVLSKR